MSLVAYGSSGESDSSDNEDNAEGSVKNGISGTGSPKSNRSTNNIDNEPHISDEEDDIVASNSLSPHSKTKFNTDNDNVVGAYISDEEDFTSSSIRGVGLTLPAPKNDQNVKDHDAIKTPTPSSQLLAGLPEPKASTESSSNVIEDELEEFVKKKEVPVEKPPPKKTAKVKITIPSLADIEYDSDGEEEPAKKKLKPTSGKSGLFSLLPAPKNAVTKEVNRALIPHTLTKKPAVPVSQKIKPSVPIKKTAPPIRSAPKLLPGIPDDESDEDDDAPGTSNFFSFGESNKKPVAAPLPMALSAPSVPETVGSTVTEQPSTETPVAIGGMEGPPLSDIADAPLQFKPVAGPSYPARPSHPWGGGSSYSQQYNMAAAAAYDEDEQEETDEQEAGGSGDMELSMEDLLRIQGKKASKREKIDIIDIHQADQVNKDELLKSLSEEQPTQMVSHSKKKNKDMPSSQQKRKHQITYLAFKAKEREIDLKNTWAQNKATKKAASSRYGF